MTTKTYKLPKRFANDHWSRDYGQNSTVVRETADHIYVQMDADDYSEMLSDADLYSDHTHFDPPQAFFGLAQSAKATVRALKAQGAPEEEAPKVDLDDLIAAVEGDDNISDSDRWAMQDAAAILVNKGDLTLTPESHAVFMAYADDAGNWSGTPLVGGNVGGSKQERGNLTDLKRKGLIDTYTDEGCVWINFTDAGIAYATKHGTDLTWINGGAEVFKAHYC